MPRSLLCFSLLVGLAALAVGPAHAQVNVTFRFLPDLTVPPITNVVRAFVPGTMPAGTANDWGPNSNGNIAPTAPSLMTYDAGRNEYRYTVSLAPGEVHSYKIHYHTTNTAPSYGGVWITDPLGTETTGGNNDSVVRVADPMAFQLAREQNAAGQVDTVSVGLFGTEPIASVEFQVNNTVYTTGITNTGNGIYALGLPTPVAPSSYVRVTATDQTGRTVTRSIGVIPPSVTDAARPVVDGRPVRDGVTRLPDGGVVFSLWAPKKGFVHLIGSFNGWTANDASLMRRDAEGDPATSDSTWWWIRVDGLDPAQPHTFQYLIDGERRVVDPYAQLVLDPSNDTFLTEATFPNRPPYPAGQTGIVGVFWPARFDYVWQTADYTRPDQKDLVIYELLVRDFVAAHDFDTIADTLDYLRGLGVNALELMPVSEFAGNLNWGYQPTFHLALDKYYGPPEHLKRLVDEAHARGMAVILDVVYNHADSPSPLVDLYGCAEGNPYTNNPARHQFNVFCDLDHSNAQTQYWLDRANEFWLREYRIDGYRFDLTLGFKQTGPDFPGNSGVNQHRVDLLARMVNEIYDVDPAAYVILEHLVDSQAEYRALAQIGRSRGLVGPLLWNNMNRPYSQLAMGYPTATDFPTDIAPSYPPNFFGAPADRSYVHNAIAYMESHDEQWLMRRMLAFGNQSNAAHNTRQLAVALDRMKISAAFLLTVPGPKMLWQFGELGYGFGTNECLPESGVTCTVGRTDAKPIRWDYAADPQRRRVYDTYAALNRLRAGYAIFRSADTQVTFGGSGQAVRTIRLSLPGAPAGEPTEVVIAGNFGVTATTATPGFPTAGAWYDYFYDGTFTASGSTQTVPLLPGEFHIWTNVDVPSPAPGLVVGNEDGGSAGAARFALGDVFPNPVRRSATIRFSLAESGPARLDVFDVLGRRVATLQDGALPAGEHEATLQASGLPAGVYVLRLTAGDRTATRRVTLAR